MDGCQYEKPSFNVPICLKGDEVRYNFDVTFGVYYCPKCCCTKWIDIDEINLTRVCKNCGEKTTLASVVEFREAYYKRK